MILCLGEGAGCRVVGGILAEKGREEFFFLEKEDISRVGGKTRQEGLLVRRYFECVLELLRR